MMRMHRVDRDSRLAAAPRALPRWLTLSLVIGLCSCAAGGGFAQTVSDESAVKAARETLDGFPWYDASRDDIQRVDVDPPKDLKNRHSRWEAGRVDWDFPDWGAALLEIVARALPWVLVAAFLYLVYLMVRAFLTQESAASSRSSVTRTVSVGEVDRVDSLPFQLERPRTSLLDEARRRYEEGLFGEAIIYLYSYQLLQLDKHQLIHLTRGKTNRQYLREVRRRPLVRALLEHTMVVFEDVFFGNHSLDRSRFESCWNRLEEFHREIERAFS